MDTDGEMAKVKLIVVVLGLFIVSTFYSCQELKYSTSGKTAEGTIDGVGQERGRRGGVYKAVRYHYHRDDGELRNGSYRVDNDWIPPANGRIQVEYLSDSSRLAGSRNIGALVLFFGSLAALLVAAVLFWWHVRDATRPSTPRRR